MQKHLRSLTSVKQEEFRRLALWKLLAFRRESCHLLVHWPSDVLAGAIIGMFCGLLATNVAAFACGWLRKTHIAA